MHWQDTIFEGEHGDWQWFVSRRPIDHLDRLVIQQHLGRRLWITAFDGGPIKPTPKEAKAGWRLIEDALVSPPLSPNIGEAMVSPPLFPGVNIPCDQFDEWYIFEDGHAGDAKFEVFVNYLGFNLADPREMTASYDPTWERSGLDWLYPLQEQFWRQIERLSPISYICSGTNDIVVTRNEEFANTIRQVVRSEKN